MLNYETKNPDKLPTWLKEYPVTLTQFLFYLYHNVMVSPLAFICHESYTFSQRQYKKIDLNASFVF